MDGLKLDWILKMCEEKIKKLIKERDDARRELCEIYCDLEFNKKSLFMLPQEYADFREWDCYANKEKEKESNEG